MQSQIKASKKNRLFYPKAWLASAALVVISLALALVCVEIFIRIYFGPRYAPQSHIYLIDSTLGWKPRPNLDDTFWGPDFSMAIKTDRFGCRLGRLGDIPAEAKLVILAGDSFAYGWGVSTGETVASHLDELVSARWPDTRVVNLGVNGYGTLQSALRLNTYLEHVDAERVRALIYLHIHNDMADNVIFVQVRNKQRKVVYEGNKPSFFHVVNFFLCRTKQRHVPTTTDKIKLMSEDSGGAFRFPTYPVSSDSRGIQWDNRFVDIGKEDVYQEYAWKNRKLTKIQEELLADSLKALNCCKGNFPVLHLAGPGVPEWYAETLRILLSGIPDCNRPILFKKSIDIEEFSGRYSNKHSGGHFTPGFSAFYAKQILNQLIKEEFIQ